MVGSSTLTDPKKLGRLGGKTIGLYLMTTAIAISIALLAASLLQPGSGADLPVEDYSVEVAPSIKDVIIGMIPKNPIAAMADGNMLPIIVFAILFGLAITMCGAPGSRMRSWFEDANAVVMQLVLIVMKLAPYGVFALIATTASELGLDAIAKVGKYFLLVFAVLLVHLFIVYPVILKLFSGLNPMIFLRKMRNAQVFAFSTASSNATIPVTMRTVQQRLGVDRSVASFTVPLGATINMDGTAIMQGVATIFIAQAYNIPLEFSQILTVVLMATMASIGAAGVPGVGLILLATVLTQVGLPVEGIAMIIGIDRLLDMTRTAVNISGDATVTAIVAKSEGALDEEIYHDADAGIITDQEEDDKT